jgi:hypothetical protein
MNLHGWIIIGGWDPPNTSCIAGLHALAPLGASVVECSGDDTLAVHIKTLRRGWPYLRIIPGMYAYHSIAGHWDHPDYWERVRRALEVAADLCGSHVVLLDVETVFSRLPTQQITWRGATRALGQTERAWWIYPALIGNPLAESFIKAMYAAMGDRVRFVTNRWTGANIGDSAVAAETKHRRQLTLCPNFIAEVGVRVGSRGDNDNHEAAFVATPLAEARAAGAKDCLIYSGAAVWSEAAVVVATALKGVQL